MDKNIWNTKRKVQTARDNAEMHLVEIQLTRMQWNCHQTNDLGQKLAAFILTTTDRSDLLPSKRTILGVRTIFVF